MQLELKVQITNWLGVTSTKMNDLQAAAKYFEQTLAIAPTNKTAKKKFKAVRAKIRQQSNLTPATLMGSTNLMPPIPVSKDSTSSESPACDASQQCDVVRKLIEQHTQNPDEVSICLCQASAHTPLHTTHTGFVLKQ